MKKRVVKRTTRRAVARGTTRRPNPRYVVYHDDYDVMVTGQFTKADAIAHAKRVYPHLKGKWTAKMVDKKMFPGTKGGDEMEACMRAERKATQGTTTRARRIGTHIHADLIDHLDVAKVHNPEINSVEDVWEAISGERVINQSRIAPYGNYSSGLILEEYSLSDGTYLQVALDPSVGNDPVEWAHTEESADDWLVG